MNGKILLLSAAVLFIGMFVMPSTLSLFAGMHTFKSGAEIANENGCRKCHEDIYEELHSPINQVHWNMPGAKGNNDVFRCSECHTVKYNIGNYFQTNNTNYSGGHAATSVACLSCHSEASGLKAGNVCDSCHSLNSATEPGHSQFPMHALAFRYGVGHPEDIARKHCGQCHNVTSTYTSTGALAPTKDNVFIKLVNARITGTDEAHTPYYYQSEYPDNQTTIKLKDSNTACIGCHSHVGVSITWKRSIGYELIVNSSNGTQVITMRVLNATNTTITSGQ